MTTVFNFRYLIASCITLAAILMSSIFAPVLAGAQSTGNGAVSGSHYNLNIIGVSKGKTADMTGDNGHRIFVNLFGKTSIGLNQSTDGTFQVLDANGTDGKASF